MNTTYQNVYESYTLKIGSMLGDNLVLADLGVDERPNGRRYRKYRLRCKCGREFELRTSAILHGNGRHSCAYCRNERLFKGKNKLAIENPRLFSIWIGMKWRCEKAERGPTFLNYRGRGISVCKEWSESFDAFCEWALSHGYRSDLTIDRINVDGNYEPSNCRWADWKTQANNKRPRDSVKMVMVLGELLPVVEAADMYGVRPELAFMRLKRGWTPEETFEVTGRIKQK